MKTGIRLLLALAVNLVFLDCKNFASEISSYESHGPMCGLYCVIAAAKLYGKEVEVEAIWSPEFVSKVHGSTAADITRALHSAGLEGVPKSGLSWYDLVTTRAPLILHSKSAVESTRYNHWVLLASRSEEGSFVVFDPPFPFENFSVGALSAKWDGIAIEVLDPDDQRTRRIDFLPGGTIHSLVVLCSMSLVSAICSRFRDATMRIQLVAIVAVASACALFYHSVALGGFLKNRAGVAAVISDRFNTQLDTLEYDMLVTHLSQANVVLIDARKAGDFKNGTIPGALNLPVDAPLGLRERVLRAIPRSSKLIVFCQSVNCQYDDEVARFLLFNGFHDTNVYRGGYREWQQKAIENEDD